MTSAVYVRRSLEELLQILEQNSGDRDVTLFKFSTGWKAVTGTPDFGFEDTRDRIFALPTFETPKDAVIAAIARTEGQKEPEF